MLKKIGIVVAVLVVVAGGAVFYLGSNLDSYIRSAVEKYGSAATKCVVELDGVKLSLASGEGSLSGLSVGNPAGFSPKKAFYLGSISLKLDTNSVTAGGTGPIVIKELTIQQPQVTYELDGSGNTNLNTIQQNTMTYAGAGGSGGGDAGKGSRKLIITDLYIRSGQVGISAPGLENKNVAAPLPDIHLTNIGKGSGGATPAEVAQKVLGAISAASAKVATLDMAKQLKDQAGGMVRDQLKGLLGN